jgi:hypothetical protein
VSCRGRNDRPRAVSRVDPPVDPRIDPPVDLRIDPPVDPRIDPRIDLRMTARNINFTAEDSSTLSTAEDPSTPSNGNSSFSSEASSEVGQRADGARARESACVERASV